MREWLSRLDRVQKSTPFKIAASVLIVALAIGAFATYYISVTLPTARQAAIEPVPTADGTPADVDTSALDAARRAASEVWSGRADATGVGVGIAALAAIALTIVWLGLGLTYLALLLLAAGSAVPLSRFESTRSLARIVVGVAVLTGAFTALMQGLRALFSGSGPVLAVARNVLNEAVRMKVSVVFIVLLIFGLASLPGLLNEGSPLRYRVQSFLQYGTGGSFWIIAVLVLFFCVSSVAFEQRDKQIWQTMTKPVAPWKYIFGKWLGAVGLAGVLLIVACSGVFLFTEYLRQQPAYGEAALLAAGHAGWSEDRRVLETQVLMARQSVGPAAPVSIRDEEFITALQSFIDEQRKTTPDFAKDPAELKKVRDDLFKSLMGGYFAIGPGDWKQYLFRGLQEARRLNAPITLRYKVDSGSNAPDQIYRLSFAIPGLTQFTSRETGLGQLHTLWLAPQIITADGQTFTFEDPMFQEIIQRGPAPGMELVQTRDIINEQGELVLQVHNGLVYFDAQGNFQVDPNPETISFPPDGLEFSYAVATYRQNFLRAVAVLWVKLAFLAMLAITAATFLNFPVACLVVFGAFLAAEATPFIVESLESYGGGTGAQAEPLHETIIGGVARGVTLMFKSYAELRPTTKLVDGELIRLPDLARGIVVLTAWCAALYTVAVLIFRRRELATYSGQ